MLTTVNLNYSLCHSPYDPFAYYGGDHYIACGAILLNVFSFVARIANYLVVVPLKVYLDYRERREKMGLKQ
jgi:hypothetical protein